ncbi:transposase [Micromonosporaceae bacterium Da 78-11]
MSSNKQPAETNGSGPVNPAPRPSRRSFTAEYKAKVVAEYEAAPHGEKSAVLRREGLFHSHVQEWTRARNTAAPTSPTNGNGNTSATTARLTRAERETERLRAENARLNAKLAQTQAALSIMGKAHELLASLAESTDTPPSSSR